MKFLVVLALLLAVSESQVRRPIPYQVYVSLGGLPYPEALRKQERKTYTLEDVSNVTRIVGGSSVANGEYPHICSMQRTSHMCGGTIYNARTIITACHCVDGQSASNIRVRYGSINHGSGGTLLALTRIVPHGSYSASTINHDIALLILASAIATGTQAQHVKLCSSPPADGASCTAVGWGSTSSGGSCCPASLLKVSVPVVSQTQCRQSYGTSAITDNMLCAGVTGKDSCQGDSGGPLYNSQKELCGIVSWGRGCAAAGYPGVYTRLLNYVSWIQANAQN